MLGEARISIGASPTAEPDVRVFDFPPDLRYLSFMKSSWRPILDEVHSAQAVEIARVIMAAIARGEGPAPEAFGPRQVQVWSNVLGTGSAGYSLVHAYLYLAGAGDEHSDQAIEYLDRASDFMAEFRMAESLYYGFPGIAWVTAHLAGKLFEDDPEDGVDLDEALVHFLEHPDRPGEYDLLNGFAGLGLYSIERLPRPSAARCLERVVSSLAARAERTAEGAAFFTPGEEMLPLYRETYPQGGFNLGVAHGLAGVIALLGAVCSTGIAAREARALLDATVSWLMAREMPPESPYRFPHFHAPGVEPPRGRLAWCYGDLGISVALVRGGGGAGAPVGAREALRIARDAARRDPGLSRVQDVGLCHGSAGAGHLFNRLYQATGDEELGAAARYWFARAFEMRRPGAGLAGFLSYGRNAGQGAGWSAEPGFLSGAAGIALALLAAATPVPPAWDRLLLASLPESSSEDRNS
jgi:hypothetical protein